MKNKKSIVIALISSTVIILSTVLVVYVLIPHIKQKETNKNENTATENNQQESKEENNNEDIKKSSNEIKAECTKEDKIYTCKGSYPYNFSIKFDNKTTSATVSYNPRESNYDYQIYNYQLEYSGTTYQFSIIFTNKQDMLTSSPDEKDLRKAADMIYTATQCSQATKFEEQKYQDFKVLYGTDTSECGLSMDPSEGTIKYTVNAYSFEKGDYIVTLTDVNSEVAKVILNSLKFE